jgi:histidine kinase
VIELEGYCVAESIHQGLATAIYRGVRSRDALSVVIKATSSEYPDPKDLARLKLEYDITAKLDLPEVVKVLVLEKHNNGLALVKEDCGGAPLKQCLGRGRITVPQALDIASRLAGALGRLHNLGVIHKDINPSNIIYDAATGEVRITDFGIATFLTPENVAINVQDAAQGTLAYMSPEQTGRMNRCTDYRSDLYALGVTLYEMLTGVLPFQAEDPLELVHAHIARRPTAPDALCTDIPPPVAEIVMKLLEKNPEARYRSAFGLKADVDECAQRLRDKGFAASFPLGRKDVSDKFRIPQKLYGRERERRLLVDLFERTAMGASQLLLVSGFSGIGKSALVQEIQEIQEPMVGSNGYFIGGKFVLVSGFSGIGESALVQETQEPMVRSNGYFIRGKFDQFQRNVPYSALVQAFRGLLRHLLAESDEHIDRWRERLTQALGVNGQIVVDVIPEVEWVIGPQPPVPDLLPAETQNRFNFVFQNFIRAFAAPEHPLVLFLDDLQWADLASLKLLQLLMAHTDQYCLLVVAAYRDNEVGTGHPIVITTNAIRQDGGTVHEMALAPLGLDDVTRLLADMLACDAERLRTLAKLTIAKTDGNPFFVNEFLKSLHREHLLSFDHARSCWNWDLAKIEAADITDNVVELMSRKIRSLPAASRSLCELASCIGNRFDLRTLAAVNSKTGRETAAELHDAVLEGLVVPQSELCRLAGLADMERDDVSYRFLHDRVQQAAYALIPDEHKSSLHLAIGQWLMQRLEAGERESVFDVVNHMNQGALLLTDAGERQRLARLNLEAGNAAVACNAYAAALAYCTAGLDLLPEAPWQCEYDLTFALHLQAIQAALLSAQFEQMERLMDSALPLARAAIDKVKLLEARIQAQIAQNRLFEAVKTAISAMQMLGIHFPAKPRQLHVLLELAKTRLALGRRRISSLIDVGEMKDESFAAAMRIMTNVFSAAYISYPAMMPLFVLRQVQISIRHGNHALSSFAYANYGLILCGILGDIPKGYAFGQLALQVVEKLGAHQVRTKTGFSVSTFISHAKEPLQDSLQPMLDAYQNGLETGDLEYAAWSTLGYSYSRFITGAPLGEIESEMNALLETVARLKQESVLSKVRLWRQAVANLTADEPSSDLTGDYYDEASMLGTLSENNQAAEAAQLHLNKLMLAFLFGDYARAVQSGGEMRRYLFSTPGTFFIPLFYFYDSLARLAAEGDADLLPVRQNQRKLRQLVQHAPMNHEHKHWLVEAECCRVRGRNERAARFYELAIDGAKKNGFQHEEALAAELAARFYLAGGRTRIGKGYLVHAHYLYRRWGAHGLAARAAAKSSSKNFGALDLATVLKASTAISGEIVMEKLLPRLMTIALENAGAETGHMLLYRDGRLQLAASGSVAGVKIADGRETDVAALLPMSVVQYVSRTGESVICGDAGTDKRFSADPFIVRNRSKSIQCTPILSLGHLTGMLYLENPLTTDAFTDERLELLKVLSGQIAVSINNAMLYENLEQTVRQRTREIVEEKKKSESLLLNILPAETAEELMRVGAATVRRFDSVSIMFTDFKDFTRVAAGMTPEMLVAEIDHCFRAFDNIVEKYGVEKIKTIGDAYMCAGGLPKANATHAVDVVNAGLEIRDFMCRRREENERNGVPFFETRIGIHTGPVVAGVVGLKKFAYDIWGDTVNLASRLESAGEAGQVNISQSTYELVENRFECAYRGKIAVKNAGDVDMFFVQTITGLRP